MLGARGASLSPGEKLRWKSRRRWKQAPGSQGSLWLLLAKPLSNARWEASAKSERLPTPSRPPRQNPTNQTKVIQIREGKEEGMGGILGL